MPAVVTGGYRLWSFYRTVGPGARGLESALDLGYGVVAGTTAVLGVATLVTFLSGHGYPLVWGGVLASGVGGQALLGHRFGRRHGDA